MRKCVPHAFLQPGNWAAMPKLQDPSKASPTSKHPAQTMSTRSESQPIAAHASDAAYATNLFGQTLIACSTDPMTGFFRDGCCHTGSEDSGRHLVCAVMTAEFLAFSREAGNDLSTPRPEWSFPGLKPGDRWCLCALRWKEAFEAGKAPQVVLEATNEKVLRLLRMEDLVAHAFKSQASE